MSRIDALLDRQHAALASLEDREVRAVLRAYDDGRRELRERLLALKLRGLDGSDSWTAQHTRVALAQVELGMAQLQARLLSTLDDAAVTRGERAAEYLLRVGKLMDPRFRGAGVGLEVGVLRSVTQAQGTLLHRYSVQRYGAQLIDRVQAELARSVTSQRTPYQVVNALAGPQGLLAGQKHRASLIARMEMARAYDVSHQAALEHAREELDVENDPDPLLKKADEAFDRRNHPFSRALHNRVAPVDGEWEVPVSEVRRWAQALGEGVSGILWRLDGNAYKGGTYPGHFGDRGRQVPWRMSWGRPQVEQPPKKRRAKTPAAKPAPTPAPAPAPPRVAPRPDVFRLDSSVPRSWKSQADDARLGYNRIPDDMLRHLASRGYTAAVGKGMKDVVPRAIYLLLRRKRSVTKTLGLTDTRNGRTWMQLAAFRKMKKRAQTPGHTVLHEFFHAVDYRTVDGRVLSDTAFFRQAHKAMVQDGSLRRWLTELGQPHMYPYFLDRSEAWAELLGQSHYEDKRREVAERIWPGLLGRMEQEIRDAIP